MLDGPATYFYKTGEIAAERIYQKNEEGDHLVEYYKNGKRIGGFWDYL